MLKKEEVDLKLVLKNQDGKIIFLYKIFNIKILSTIILSKHIYIYMTSNKNILIIQTSPPHSASTVLINALHGLIEPMKDIKVSFLFHMDDAIDFNNIGLTIIKTHNTNIYELITKYHDKYELYFVCSERDNEFIYIDNRYKLFNNVIVFDFNELNETEANPLSNIIETIYHPLSKLLAKHDFIKLNKETGIQRLMNMNKRYQEIKNKPFNYVDPFFEIHGSHRNRRQV
jgi:hypothetical protein